MNPWNPRLIHWFIHALLALSLKAACTEPPIPVFRPNTPCETYTWLRESRHSDPNQVFSHDGSTWRISGTQDGYLATRQSFQNYCLDLEFRWGLTNAPHRIGKARDSGVFLHATGPDGNSHDGNGAFMAALECNLFQGATGDFLLIRGDDALGKLIEPRLTARVAECADADGWWTWKPDGTSKTLTRWGRINWIHKSALWKDEWNFHGPKEIEKQPGQWNRLHICSHSQSLSIYLNQTLINQAFEVYPDHGQILLQSEGSEIFFRNLFLTPNPSATQPTHSFPPPQP